MINIPQKKTQKNKGWDREGERETQKGGDMGICVYV